MAPDAPDPGVDDWGRNRDGWCRDAGGHDRDRHRHDVGEGNRSRRERRGRRTGPDPPLDPSTGAGSVRARRPRSLASRASARARRARQSRRAAASRCRRWCRRSLPSIDAASPRRRACCTATRAVGPTRPQPPPRAESSSRSFVGPPNSDPTLSATGRPRALRTTRLRRRLFSTRPPRSPRSRCSRGPVGTQRSLDRWASARISCRDWCRQARLRDASAGRPNPRVGLRRRLRRATRRRSRR